MKIGLGILLFLSTYSVLASDTLMMRVQSDQKTFVVRLDANPTTGYQWAVDTYDKKILQLLKQTYIAPQTRLVGAGGHTLFSFKLIPGQDYPKSTTLKFRYMRAWEKSRGKEQIVIVLFK